MQSDFNWFSQMQTLVEAISQRVDSNAKAIQSLTDDISELKLIVAEDHSQYQHSTGILLVFTHSSGLIPAARSRSANCAARCSA